MKKLLSAFNGLAFMALLTFGVSLVSGVAPAIIGSIVLGGTAVLDLSGQFTGILGANYASTVLLDAYSYIADSLAGKINQNELRRPLTGGLRAFIDSAPNLIMGGSATLENLKKSSAQATKVPVLTKLSAANLTARTCGTTNAGDSSTVDLSYSTYAEPFSISHLMMKNNQVDYAIALRHGLMECFRNLHNRLDVAGVAYLESNKSSVNDGSINQWNGPTDTMHVTLANKNQYFASITTEMAENDFNGLAYNVHTVSQMLQKILQGNEGSANNTNLAPQLSAFEHYATNNFAVASGTQSSSYIFVPGTVGIVGPWINGLHREGHENGTDVWTTIPDPFIPGWVWELKINKACTDSSSSVTGGQADLVDQYVISGEFAFVKAYTSTSDTGIYKYAQDHA
jgi:hypothetical protein